MLTEGRLQEMYSFYTRDEPNPLIPTFLMTILTWMANAYQPLFHRSPEPGRELTSRFLKLLQKHHVDKQRVTDYAGLLHVTPNHLNKVVKETTSRSPTRWIDEAILLDAKVLLAQTLEPVGAIAAAAGIADASYPCHFARDMGLVESLWFHSL